MGSSEGRIEALDALRGFAVFGILLINIQVFSGWGFLGEEGRQALGGAAHDAWLVPLLDVLVRAKFYSLFALMFGYSFTLMAASAGDRAVSMHLRRMAGLLLFGLAHTLLLWPWDILLLYALTGLVLTPFLARRTPVLLAWGLGVLAAGAWLQWQHDVLAGQNDFVLATLEEGVAAFAAGSYAEVVAVNLRLTLSVAVEWLQGLRPVRVLGLFLIGAAGASLGLAAAGRGRRGKLWAAAVVGLSVGLVLALAEHAEHFDSARLERLQPLGEALGPPLLAIGYAAALLLWWNASHPPARWTRRLFAPVGRMALTNYIAQSALCVPLFYGFGAGLFAEWSLARQMLFVLVLFGAQVIFSRIWLKRFRQGPLEWLWRTMIGGNRAR